ncbi:uncharacterized protein VICG_01654 [Vittaforma corneae ATCC 50505]|uniref:Uncharacterized protein n=1 Tax=Vittaforma corneae (strain ATCC 50505) TaxID=993615 RepID=L2GKA6_VITCO|nr:uncharacterized protein VICG_01654 [Vittaforma corneae ATCC 50505]ELA41281.1 hypothetical protein VICG_01654 [Vittaforma corneae ATCC 50505]
MRQKNTKHIQTSLEYLLKLAQILPNHLGRKKAKDLMQICRKYQIRLGKVKQIICKKCYTVLTPKISSESKLEKRECGFGMSVQCNSCSSSTFTVKRGA